MMRRVPAQMSAAPSEVLRASLGFLRRPARGHPRASLLSAPFHFGAPRPLLPPLRYPSSCSSPPHLRAAPARHSLSSSASAATMAGKEAPSADDESLIAGKRSPPSVDVTVVAEKEAPTADDVTMDAVQRRLMFEDECILVDENDNVVGHDSKYNCHLMEKIDSENLLHRAFSVFLFNSKYELLLQQRSETKVTFPRVWTNTCCSHPLYRDSELIEKDFLGVRNAAQRKLLDELGIQAEHVPVDQFVPVGRMLYKAPSDGKWGEHELDYLLFTVRDVEVNPNPDEVADVMYVDREKLKELLRKADSGEDDIKLSPWFRLVVDNFMFKWWDHVEKGTLGEVVDLKTIHKLTS